MAHMKYAGNLIILDDQGNVVYDRSLSSDEMIEALLNREVSAVETEEESEIEKREDIPSQKRKLKRNSVERGAQNKFEGGPTARVESLLAQGKTEEEIMEALEIKRPALLYHFRKLGVNLKLRKKGVLTPPPDQIVPEGGGDPYFPIKDPTAIRKIWECVDEGLRTAEQINTRTGFRKEAIKDVLMQPRPSL